MTHDVIPMMALLAGPFVLNAVLLVRLAWRAA